MKGIGTEELKSVIKNDVPEDENILSCRFVLTINNAETKHPTFSAILAVQDHLDKYEALLVPNYSHLHQISIKVVQSIASLYNSQILSYDVTQHFIQSTKTLLGKSAYTQSQSKTSLLTSYLN